MPARASIDRVERLVGETSSVRMQSPRLRSESEDLSIALREVAKAAGTSTMSIYTLFGSREGLVRAAILAGFDDYADHLAAAGNDNPLLRLWEIGQICRRELDEQPQTFGVVERAVRAARVAGMAPDDDDRVVAIRLWGAIHGVVCLEIAGFFDTETADLALGPLLIRALAIPTEALAAVAPTMDDTPLYAGAVG